MTTDILWSSIVLLGCLLAGLNYPANTIYKEKETESTYLNFFYPWLRWMFRVGYWIIVLSMGYFFYMGILFLLGAHRLF